MKLPFIFIFTLLLTYAWESSANKLSLSVGKVRIAKAIDKQQLPSANLALLQKDIHQAINSTQYFQLVSHHTAKTNSTAQYHLVPTVTEFVFQRQHKPIANIANRFKQIDTIYLATHIEIYNNDNRDIITTLTFNSEIIEPTKKVNGINRHQPEQRYFGLLSERNAANLANHLIDSLFPTKVLKVRDQLLWVNRGENSGINPNSIFVVFESASTLIDPYTDEVIGTQEIKIGKAKIQETNPKFSILKCLKCVRLNKAKQYIVRKQ